MLTLCGFNCGKYDLNLVKTYLFKWLKQKGYQPFVIKRDNSYLLLATSKFRFLDISNFIAAGHSYESYLRAYEVEESKGCFPYEWFDSAEKLEHTTLPPHKAFYSTLKAQNISAEKYQECLAVWKKEHMNTFRYFLVYYNNKDVIGFLLALKKKQKAFFRDNGMTFLDDALSLPGLTLDLLYKLKDPNSFLVLFNQTHADLHTLLKKN